MIDGLKKIFGDVNASDRKLDLLAYSTDASGEEGHAVAVVFPKNGEEVQKLVRLAKRFEVPLVPRGSGTNVVGSCVPERAIVVDMCKMDKVIDINPEDVIVEAGVTLEELNHELRLKKKLFPIDPESNTACTVGGMVGANAIGRRVREYGRTEDWVLELEVIDGTGKYLKLKDEKVKHFIGAEGSMGIVLTAKLKVIPYSPRIRSLNLMGFNTITLLIERALTLMKNPNVTFLEYWDEEISEMMELDMKNHLFVEYADDGGKIKDKDEIAHIWKLRDKVDSMMKSRGYTDNECPQIPTKNMDKYLYWLNKKGVPTMALLGPNLVTSYFRGKELLKKDVLQTAVNVNGKINAIGTGLRYKEYQDYAKVEKLKEHYDPKKLMNRGIHNGE